jgi:hypothetical protein
MTKIKTKQKTIQILELISTKVCVKSRENEPEPTNTNRKSYSHITYKHNFHFVKNLLTSSEKAVESMHNLHRYLRRQA